MSAGKRVAGVRQKKRQDYSKQLLGDVRGLLWVVTIGALVLAAYCIRKGFTGSLPWLASMVGLPWTAWGTVASFYLNMSKSDHRDGGITMETARANGFVAPNTETDASQNMMSPKI